MVSNLKPPAANSAPIAGRSLEVEYLLKLLNKDDSSVPAEDREEPRPRLVVLTGCHGVGKSVVANAVGSRLVAPPTDGSSHVHEERGHAHLGCRLTGDGGVEEGVADTPTGPAFRAVIKVDCRGCDGTQESLFARIFGAFGFPYRLRFDNGI